MANYENQPIPAIILRHDFIKKIGRQNMK